MIYLDSAKGVDAGRYLEVMSRTTAVFINERKYDELLHTLKLEVPEVRWRLENTIKLYSGDTMAILDSGGKSMRDILIGRLHVPAQAFMMWDKHSRVYKESMDQKKVLNPLYQRLITDNEKYCRNWEEAAYILQEYLDFKKIQYRLNIITKKQSLLRDSGKVDKFGNALKAVDFEYAMADTGRIQTRNDNIQGWFPELSKTISAPAGYTLVWADLDQIDLRTAYYLYLSNEDLDIIFNKYEDKYESIVRIMHEQIGKEFNAEEFKEMRKHYKVLVLAKLYGSTDETAAGSGGKDIAHQIEKFLDSNAGYQAYLELCHDYLKLGYDLEVQDYFGFRRLVIPEQKSDVLSVLLNSPVQATSKSILTAVTLHILDKFKDLGYDDEDVIPYLDRHDEILLLISDRAMKDIWVLKDCSQIKIDDWGMITMEVELGDTYKEVNEEYMNIFQKSCLDNAGKMHKSMPEYIGQEAIQRHKKYSPLAPIWVVIDPLECSYEIAVDNMAREMGYICRDESMLDLSDHEILAELSKQPMMRRQIEILGSGRPTIYQAKKTFQSFEELYVRMCEVLRSAVKLHNRYVVNLTRGIAFKYAEADFNADGKHYGLDDLAQMLGTERFVHCGVNVKMEVCNSVRVKDIKCTNFEISELIMALENRIPEVMKYYRINSDFVRERVITPNHAE